MKSIMTNSVTIHTGFPQTIQYALTETATPDGATEFGVQLKNEATGETAAVTSLTTDRQRAQQFYHRLIQGAVTPVTLLEVTEDFVADL